jgi:exodeoxyribonuclease V beta subunit
VLVDEFQDTDEGQWTIIRSAFHGHARLLLIGDPKQAIYAFRGADLSVYLSARDEAHKQFTMTTNFRSDPVTIDAQNALWQAKPVESSAFDVEGINYIEVKAHKAARLEPAKPGLEIRWIDGRAASAQGTRGSPIDGKGRGQAIAAALAAAEVKALLASTTTLKTKKLTDERLRPRDFGVLVENRYEAAAMRKALAALGIPAVAAAQGTVFASPAADWLVRWLDAVAEPSSRDIAARIVATTPLFGMSHQALATALEAEAERLAGGALVSTTGGHESVTRWAAVRAMLASARAAWRNDRFVGCFERTLSAPKGGLPCVLAQPMGERLATDLRHLVELLNERDRTRRSGPADLAQWLRLQRDEEGREFEQRLESDENAVRIETVFVSKGLQYPIVLLPFAWSQKTQPKTASALAAGRPANAGLTVRPRVGLGKQGFAALQAEVAEQSRTEALRKDYVALTRAEHLTIMWVGPIGQSNQPQKKVTKYLGGSTYHTLLRRVVDPDEQKPIAGFIDGLVEKYGKPETSPHTRFVEVTFDDVEKARREEAGSPKKTDQNSTETLDDAEKVRCEEACSPEKTDQTGPKALEKRTWNRKTSLGAGFGVTSFSELKGQGALHDADEKSRASARDDQPEGESADDGDEATFTSALTEPGEPDSDAAPLVLEGRGTEYGSFVHALYEHLDFETGRAKSGEPLESLVTTQGQAFGFDRGARAGAGARDFAVKVLDGITAHLPLTLRTPLDALPEAGAAGLGAAPAGTTLADLSINSRLDELVFDLRLGIGLRDRAGGGTPVRVETRHALAALLSHPRKDDPTWHGSAWLKSLEARDKERHQERDPERDQESGPTGGLFKNMDGFLTGSIDLVFERGGRYWVADYKTNRIKDSRPGYYGTEWMAWEMARKGYPLQSLIYTLALHRHLKQRVRDYDYDTHVGGALYLFVRGMTGPETPRDLKTGTALGVLADRWPRAVVEGVEVALGLTTQGRTR